MENNLQLTSDEKAVLESVYGRQNFDNINYNPRKLEAVRDLTAEEKKFFTGKNFVSSHFFVQTLYKVRGTVNPLKFTVTVNRTLNEKENLRANFCDLGTRTVKVIHPVGYVRPEILFRNLSSAKKDELDEIFTKVFEANIRREVDFRHDPLIRFEIYKTGNEEFAMFVSMAQVISENFDAEEFFCNLFDLPVSLNPRRIPDELPAKNYDAIREYWTKILDNPPPPAAIPYEQTSNKAYRQQAFLAVVPDDILSDLLGCAQSNRLMFMAILQSAWGFMLQLINKRHDCLFCQISSAEDFSFNVIPVRLTAENNLTVEQIVRKQFRQLIVSQPYGLSDWSLLDELTVQKKLFDHFLCFKEFTLNESNYAKYAETPAEPFGKIIFQNSFNSQDMKLSVYFRYSRKKLGIYFLYDSRQFSEGGVEKLYKLYSLILLQMITDWNAKFSEFATHVSKRIEIKSDVEKVQREDKRKRLRNFISQLPILQGEFAGTISLFDEQAELVTYYEGDRISDDMLKENFIFIADGLLSRNVNTGDGWYNTLDIIERNSFVNPTYLLEKKLYTVSAAILTDQAELLIVPHDVFIEILRKNSAVAMSVMNYALDQMQRWQTIWLQS